MEDSAEKIQISLRVPANLVAAFDRIAAATERDRTWTLLRALKLYLEGEGGAILEEAEGGEAIARGEGVDFDETMDEIDRIIADAKRTRRRAG